MTKTLGHRLLGTGPNRVIVLNDWIGDTTTWDPVLPLLDHDRMCWALVDLRGYGRSRDLGGEHTLVEASADVLMTADALGWEDFAIIGHSMSSLVALHLGQVAPARIRRIVLVAPGPPGGVGADEATAEYLRSMAAGDAAQRLAGLGAMWGDRLSDRWRMYKAQQWQVAADPRAAADYVDMFARQGLPDTGMPVNAPVLAITGEQDAEIMRSTAVHQALATICPRLLVQPIQDAGHYPMQEAPPLTYTLVERFLVAG